MLNDVLIDVSSIEIISSKLYFFISLKNIFNSSFSFLGSPLYVFGKCLKVALFRVILLSLIISDKYCLEISRFLNLSLVNLFEKKQLEEDKIKLKEEKEKIVFIKEKLIQMKEEVELEKQKIEQQKNKTVDLDKCFEEIISSKKSKNKQSEKVAFD